MMSAAPRKPDEVLDAFGLVGTQRTKAARGLARSLIKLEREQARLLARYPSATAAHRWLESSIGVVRERLRIFARPVVHEEGA